MLHSTDRSIALCEQHWQRALCRNRWDRCSCRDSHRWIWMECEYLMCQLHHYHLLHKCVFKLWLRYLTELSLSRELISLRITVGRKPNSNINHLYLYWNILSKWQHWIFIGCVLVCLCVSGSYSGRHFGMALCAHLHQSWGKQNTQATYSLYKFVSPKCIRNPCKLEFLISKCRMIRFAATYNLLSQK